MTSLKSLGTAKKDFNIKANKMLSFLLLMINSAFNRISLDTAK